MRNTVFILLFLYACISATAQSGSGSVLPQYLYPEFSSTTVKMKNGSSQTSKMNYNMLTGNMVFERDGKLYDLLNAEMIDTIYLQNSKFVRFGKAFYEVIHPAPISLFLHHKGSLVSAGKPAGYGSTSQTSSIESLSGISTNDIYLNLELPPDYNVKVEQIYWLRKDNDMFSFINIRQFLKIFPDKEADLKEYIKKNHISIEKRDDLIKLISYCNNTITTH